MKYWPEVVAVVAEPTKVRTKATKGQYSPVPLVQATLVSGLLYGTRAMLGLNLRLLRTENTELMTVSMETVRMEITPQKTNQSERSYLSQDYLAI